MENERTGWDVLVAGAGPAGSTVARLLAGEGLSVLLVDRSSFPRNKVCGCCLNGAALNSLEGTGLGGLLPSLGASRIKEFDLIGYRRRVELPLPGGWVLSRKTLDDALVREARLAGSRFLQETVATLGHLEETGWTVELKPRDGASRYETRARVVICADGLEGGFLRRHSEYAPAIAPASRIGVGLVADGSGADLPRGVIRMVVAPEGYVGMVKLEDGSLDVAAALDRSRPSGASPEVAIRHILASNGVDSGFKLTWGVRGTPPLTRYRTAIAGPRLFLIGDSTGYVEPFTGEGIAWAMNSALLVVPFVLQSCGIWDPSLADRWVRVHRREIGRRQAACRVLRAVLSRPRVSRLLLLSLGVTSFWARPFIAGLNRPIVERH